MSEIQCSTEKSNIQLNRDFWDTQYQNNNTGWDLGCPSPPLCKYIDGVNDKTLSILIPGAGNAYEAEYLACNGFTDITILDIAPTVIQRLKTKFQHRPSVKIVQVDFFMHIGNYDLIIEQTFFCAINPELRRSYVAKMYNLLKPNGILAGLLFNRTFEQNPPFGGSAEEYEELFKPYFDFLVFEPCQNSAAPRAGSELFFCFRKK